jgi:thiol-disulfide isomerase/thioredoxin
MPRFLSFLPILLTTLLITGCDEKRPRSGEAPVFSLKTYTGESFTVDAKESRATLIVFWATWCGPCLMEIPTLIALNEKYKSKNFRVIAINVDDAEGNKARPILQRYGVNYPVLIGDDKITARFGGVKALPTSFLIDSQGILRDVLQGLYPEEEIEKRILSLL